MSSVTQQQGTTQMVEKPRGKRDSSSPVGSDGYVRVRPSWAGSHQVHLGDSSGIGRQIGWLLGAMIGAPVMLSISWNLAFWQILVGIAVCSVLGAGIGHVLARLIWSRFKREIIATDPTWMPARELAAGMWMMTQNDGTNRAMRVEAPPRQIADPVTGEDTGATISVRMSTGRDLVLPAEQQVTVVELTEEVQPTRRPADGEHSDGEHSDGEHSDGEHSDGE